MKKFFLFFCKKVHWVFFLIGICFSFFLLFNNQQFQRSRYLVVVQEIEGRFHSIFDSFFSYINLKSTNSELIKKVSELETKLFLYKHVFDLISNSNRFGTKAIDSTDIVYQFIPAHVINSGPYTNYIIIDKGIKNGIQKNMGVLGINGIVGVVYNVSAHFSKIITLLNSNLKLSCQVKKSCFFGLLAWDGKDSRYTWLTELPPCMSFSRGDTVVTTGYSAIFPKGIPLGVIVQSKKTIFNNVTSVKVKLFTSFDFLHEVLVVKNFYQNEQNSIKK